MSSTDHAEEDELGQTQFLNSAPRLVAAPDALQFNGGLVGVHQRPRALQTAALHRFFALSLAAQDICEEILKPVQK